MRTKTEDRAFMPDLTLPRNRNFIVEDFMMANTVGLMSAGPNVGKTALSLHLAQSITTGIPFFDMEILKQTNCAFIQYDMDMTQHAEYNAIFSPQCPICMIEGKMMKFDKGNPYYDFYNLSSADIAGELIGFAEKREIGVIFIDTLSAAFPDADENNNAQMSKAVGALKMIAHQGLSIVALHHMSKSENGYSNSSRGASSIVATIDTEYKLKPSSRGAVDLEMSKCRFGKKGYLFSFTADSNGVQRAPDRKTYTNAPTKLTRLFTKDKPALTRKEIHTLLGVGTTQLQQILEDAVNNNVLVKRKDGKADVYELMEKEDGSED